MACSKITFDYFESLPFVPLKEMGRHLSPVDKIVYSLASDRWRDAIKSSGGRQKALVKVMFKEEVDEIQVLFPDDTAKCFHITFQESSSYGRSVHLERKVSNDIHNYDYRIRFDYRPHLINFYAEKFENFEQIALRLIQLIGQFFTVEFPFVTVEMGPRRLDYCFRLLASLPPGIGESLHVSECQQSVNAVHFQQLMRNVNFKYYIRVCVRFDTTFNGDEMLLDVGLLMSFNDARFLTRYHMETLEFQFGEFGPNTLRSEDFNVILRRWKEGRMREDVKVLYFEISEEQKVEVEEVVRGLDARPWDPMVRDRTHFRSGCMEEAVDMKDGLDIVNAHGLLGTVLLTNEYLKFLTWPERFPVQDVERDCRWWIQMDERQLIETQDRLQLNKERMKHDDSAEVRKEVEYYEGEIRDLEEGIKKSRIELEEAMSLF